MKNKLNTIFGKAFLCILLLPLFFIWHGYVRFYNLIPLQDSFLLILYYFGIGFILAFLLWPIFKKMNKAFLGAFILLFYQFFFGSVQDVLKKHFAGSFIVKYSFILTISILLIVFIFYRIKKRKASLQKLFLYINTLLIVLFLIDSIQLAFKPAPDKVSINKDLNLQICDTCSKPDIYLILADAYAGQKEIKDLFHYDNTPFEKYLRSKGFYIVDSSFSNYNFTGFSMASMLSLNYLPENNGSNSNKDDILLYSNTIKQSVFPRFLQKEGYRFYNYSIFDFEKNPSFTHPNFLPRRTLPIISQMFTQRILKDLGYHLMTTFKISYFINKTKTVDLRNNEKIFRLTKEIASEKTAQPKFVYTHLMMPHHPFYYDSIGHRIPLKYLVDGFYYDKNARISYLKYANKQFKKLINHILATSPTPPIILFMGDHGFREFRETVPLHYIYMNLNAILLPSGKYDAFYKGQSNVNHLRNFLNTQFHQQLPMLKDSTIFIRE